MTKKLEKVCVVGLDGVPYSLINKLADSGVMPTIAKLKEKASLSQMRVSIPEISAVSWTSFSTGVNPGIHGIFGFIDLLPDSYDYRFPSYRDCRATAIWDKVGYAGGKSIVINQPFTFPAKRVDGWLVSGFVSLNLEQGVWPSSFLKKLKTIDYHIDIDTVACRQDHDLLFSQLHKTLESRREALDLLWDENWDYCQVVVTGTDRLFHYLWDAFENENHLQHGAVLEYYQAVDRFVQYVWERFRDQEKEEAIDRFFILSDHGFCGIKREVNLNRWLMEQGYLDFMDNHPTDLTTISPTSKAFCLDPGRIYINDRDRFPRGSVRCEEIPNLMEEIGSRLSSLTYNNEKVVRKVFERDEVYQGPVAKRGPDLVVLPNHGFDMKGTVEAKTVFSKSDLTGMHTWDDAFVLTGAEVSKPILIWNLAEIILNKLTIG